MEEPVKLVETGTKYFIGHSLKHCREYKQEYDCKYYNVMYTIGFILVMGCILYYKYKGKPTEEEKEERSRKKKEYLMEKLQMCQSTKTKSMFSLNG